MEMGRLRGMITGCGLKMVAMAAMLIDHTAYLLLGCGILRALPGEAPGYAGYYQMYQVMRCVGRAAFPIYAFLLTEGIAHTRDWKRYGLRLGMFALISEIPFDLLCFQQPVCLDGQNVFFTLLLGLLAVKGAEWAAGRASRAQHYPGEKSSLAWVVAAGLGCQAAVFLRTDYDASGVLLVVLLYLLRKTPLKQCIAGFFWLLVTEGRWHYAPGLAAAFLLIGLYNGERGSKRGKYAFYAFYPLHLAALYLIYRYMDATYWAVYFFRQ
ncbi:MAG: conjugal transfer protein TraX [Lachnospiraceae bacterium]|nr:conjugal transfer protein TraX [Lachnospiraceae bacterium]